MHVLIHESIFQIRKSQSGIHTGFTARDSSRENLLEVGMVAPRPEISGGQAEPGGSAVSPFGAQPVVRGFAGFSVKSTGKLGKIPEKIWIFPCFFKVFQAQILRKYPRRSCGSFWSGLELWRPTFDRFRLIFPILFLEKVCCL